MDPLRVETVHRFVQDQRSGIAQQRGRQAQPLEHPEGETSRVAIGSVGEPHQPEDMVDPALGDPVGGRERAEMVPRRDLRVHGVSVEQ